MTIVYLIYLALALFWSIRYDGLDNDDAQKQHRYWLLCVMLILMAGLSYGLGGDKWTYMEEWKEYYDKPQYFLYEIGQHFLFKAQMPLWTLLNLCVKYLFDSFYVFQIIQAAIVNIAVFYMVKQWTNRLFLFTILYFAGGTFFRFDTEVMREGLAIACCLFSWSAYTKQRYGQAVIGCVTAVMFHLSALIFPLIFLLPKKSVTLKGIIWYQVASVAIWAGSDLIFGVILPKLPMDLGELYTKISTYILVNTTFFGFIRNYLTYLALPSIVLYFGIQSGKIAEKSVCNQWIRYSLILGVLACSLSGFTRFANYSHIFYLALLAEMVYALWSTKEHFLLRNGCFAMIIVLNMWGNMTYYPRTHFYYWQFFVPYTCILDEDTPLELRRFAHSEAVVGEEDKDAIRKIPQ